MERYLQSVRFYGRRSEAALARTGGAVASGAGAALQSGRVTLKGVTRRRCVPRTPGVRGGTRQKHDESGTAAGSAAGTSDGHRDGQDGENPWWGGLGSG